MDPINEPQQKETSPEGTTDDGDPQQKQLPTKQPMGRKQCPQTPTANVPKSRGRAKMRPGLDGDMDEDSDAFESDEERPPDQGSFGDSTILPNPKRTSTPNVRMTGNKIPQHKQTQYSELPTLLIDNSRRIGKKQTRKFYDRTDFLRNYTIYTFRVLKRLT